MEENDIKIEDENQVEVPEEQMKEPRNDLNSVFESINNNLEAIEADLAGSIPGYENFKEKVDPDAFNLCAHYIIGAGSPVKEKYSAVSKINPSLLPNQDYKEYEEEGYNQEEGGYMEKEQYEEADPIENDDKYRDAILQQKFWGEPTEYRTETITYQPSSNSKPELDIVSKYRAKYS
jgi:hypothetical protein